MMVVAEHLTIIIRTTRTGSGHNISLGWENVYGSSPKAVSIHMNARTFLGNSITNYRLRLTDYTTYKYINL